MIEIHVYGTLRRYAKGLEPRNGTVVMLEARPAETLASVLSYMAIPTHEINHIFLNAKLHATRTRTAALMGYPQTQSDLFDWNLNVPVDDGDRIGLFGTDMSILGM
jgi:hypothetical protein